MAPPVGRRVIVAAPTTAAGLVGTEFELCDGMNTLGSAESQQPSDIRIGHADIHDTQCVLACLGDGCVLCVFVRPSFGGESRHLGALSPALV